MTRIDSTILQSENQSEKGAADLLSAALAYAAKGWAIFPAKPYPDKSPYTPQGFKNATKNPAVIRTWLEKYPDALIGLPCASNGFFVVDIDRKDGRDGGKAWTELVETLGAGVDVVAGPCQATPGGGWHIFFAIPEGVEIPNNANKLAPGIDLRSNGYVCTGAGYSWLPGHGPDQPLTLPPAWLISAIANMSHKSGYNARQKTEASKPENAGNYWLNYYLARAAGNRNETGLFLACQLRDSGLSQSEAETVMIQYANMAPVSNHPYTQNEARASLKQAFTRPRRDPARLPGLTYSQGKKGNGYHAAEAQKIITVNSDDNSDAGNSIPWQGSLTDTGNAIRLKLRYGDKLRWVKEWGWLAFDGRRWQHDREGLAIRFAKDTARGIYQEAARAGDDDRSKAIAKFAGISLNRNRIEAMLNLAIDLMPARPNDFDSDPYILCVNNGLLDLRSGELRPHDPGVTVTKLSPVDYDPEATCPTWLAFLDRVLESDYELIDSIQRAVGYSLTGNISEQKLIFLYGSGANGKSTFLKTILNLMGDYGKQAAPQLLLKGDRHPTEIADLQGARFVATVEVEEGKQMAEVLVKQMTGGDMVKARFMRGDFFEYEPTHKIWLAANHKPPITGTDNAIWRRIKLIPFEVTIPEAEQDKHLIEKLKTELPGILAWAVRGCLAWQQIGIAFPDRVDKATEAYRAEMDLVAQFLEECCVINSLASVGASVLYGEYCKWCDQYREKPEKQKAFSMRLKERGFVAKDRDSYGRALYSGIGLIAPPAGESATGQNV